ncbi:hypothetical protein Q1695_001474 [Nippostrongylus brasiliensis]|nr:hypothetical protein Q1695_001474 [Nippostrongylus brasiliensis]
MLWLGLYLLVTSSNAARVLFNGMHSSDSHIGSMMPLASRLANDKYTVHFLETNMKPTHFNYPKNIDFTHIELKKDPFYVKQYLELLWTKIFGPIEFPRIWETGDNALVEMLEHHPHKMDTVLNKTWDMVVADELFSVSSYALALKAESRGNTFVTLSTCIPTNLIKYHLSLGTPFTLRPSMYHRTAVPYQIENFSSRLHSAVRETYKAIRTQHVTSNVAVKGLRKLGFHNFDFSMLATNSAYYFLDDINSLVFPSPVSTGIAEIGFNCPQVKELPSEYQEFLEDSTSKGTILVAFGSNVLWDYAPDAILNSIATALNQLKEYRIVFSYNGDIDRVRHLGGHVKVTRWAPQKEILAHNKTVLFVSHGGLKSLKDTICGATPVVYIPLFAEQSHNSELARAAGFAEVVLKNHLSAESLENTMRRVAGMSQIKTRA